MNIHFVAYTGSLSTIDDGIRNGLRGHEQMGCTSIIVSLNGRTDWYADMEAKMAAGLRVVFKLNGTGGSSTEDFIKYWNARPVKEQIDGYKVWDEPTSAQKSLVLDQLHAIHANTDKPSIITLNGNNYIDTFLTLGTSPDDYPKIFTQDNYPFECVDIEGGYAKGLWASSEEGLTGLDVVSNGFITMLDKWMTLPGSKGVRLSPANGHVCGIIIQGYHFRPSNRSDKNSPHWTLTQDKILTQLKVALGLAPYNGRPSGSGTRLDVTRDGSQILQWVGVYAWSAISGDRTMPVQDAALTEMIRLAVQDVRRNYSIVGVEVYKPGAVNNPPDNGGGNGSLAVDTIKYYPRGSWATRMTGGKFQYSDDAVNWTDVHTISGTPSYAWQTVSGISVGAHRYWRYLAPAQSWGNVAEIQFWASGANRTADGTSFGTAGSFENSGDTYDKVFDGNTGTAFDSSQASDAYVGKDFGAISPPASAVATPVASPAGGTYTSAQAVALTCATAGATMRYTTDGSDPTSGGAGTLYNAPLTGTIKVLPFGDSIVKGEGTSYQGGWRKTLKDLLTTDGLTTDFVGSQTTFSTGLGDPQHEGHDGGDFGSGRADFAAFDGIAAARLNTYNPDVVILAVGVNDVLNNRTAAQMATDLNTLLDTIWATKPNVRVMLCEVLPMLTGTNGQPSKNAVSVAFNALLPGIVATRQAAGKAVRLVGTYSAIYDDPNKASYFADGVHPTQAGYEKLGQVIHDGVAPGFATQAPIQIAASVTLKAIAYKSGMNDSVVMSAVYTINAPSGSPQLSPSSLALRYNVTDRIYLTNAGGRTVTRATSSNNAVVEVWGVFSPTGEYLPNGGGDHIVLHSAALDGSATITFTLSDGSTLTCSVTVGQETVATPVMTPTGGTYATAQNVVIICGTSGATIRFTTDGTDPTGSSTAYSTPVAITATTVLKARAFKGGSNDSPIASATYIIAPVPTGSPTRVRLFPAAGYESGCDGAIIEASNDRQAWDVLYTISGAPSAGWTDYALSPTRVYRYMRLRAASNKTLRVSELEFYSGAAGDTNNVKLTGGAFSSAFGGANYPARAFDGSTSGYFGAADVGGHIGLDVLAPNNTTPALVPAQLGLPPNEEARVTIVNIGALSIKTVEAANALVEIGYAASDWFNVNSGENGGACDVTVTLSDDSELVLAIMVTIRARINAPYKSRPDVT